VRELVRGWILSGLSERTFRRRGNDEASDEEAPSS
jgi:hypothetical protein